MAAERMQRAYELFEQAVYLPARQRDAFLAEQCGKDHALRSEVESLLEHDQQVGESFMQPPASSADANLAEDNAETKEHQERSGPKPTGPQIEGYKIVRELSRGGQGVVYQAFQESTRRNVAIKVMKEGPFASSPDKARFEREVHVLGQLKHPNIVTVYESGTSAGSFYFVMDYISGQPLDSYMSSKEHSVDDTLGLFAQICDAVNSAHLKGVIHRDLKPGNIRIDDEDQPHILDFGLAKVAAGDQEASMMTMTGQFIGSLPWSSPEQAEGKPGKIDVRTDVYSLGVILYQMLTGRFPYEVAGNMRDVLDRIMKAEPAKPSTIRKQINDEVETIVLKCLSKERERRYQTAGELGRDVQRYLAGGAIEAKRDSGWYVLKKHLARNRVPVATALAFVLLLIGATVTSSVFYFRAEEQRTQARDAATSESRQRQIAEDEAARADKENAIAQAVNDFLTNDLLAAVAPSSEAGKGKDVLMRDVLDEAASSIAGRFEKMPLVEASIRATLGSTYRQLGEYAAAEPHLARTLLLRRRELGEEQPKTLAAMNSLAILYANQGRHAEAEPLFVEVLGIRKRILGEENADTLFSMNNLALLYKQQGRYDEAEPLFVKTVEILRLVRGREDPATLVSMNNLALLYRNQGRYDEAESQFLKTLEIQKRVRGEGHPDTLDTMNNLAGLYWKQGRNKKAEPLYIKALELQKHVRGDEHPETLGSMSNLAILYWSQSRYNEAESLFLKTLEIQKRRLGAEHSDTLGSMSTLANLYVDQRRYDEAEPLYLKTLEIQKRTLGEEHSDTLITMNNLAVQYFRQGRYDESEPLHVKTLEIRKRVLRDDHPDTLGSMNNLADLYKRWGRMDDARPLLRAIQEANRRRADRARNVGG